MVGRVVQAHTNTISDLVLVPKVGRMQGGLQKFFSCSKDSSLKCWSVSNQRGVEGAGERGQPKQF